jgi:hypothetical protein
MASSAPCDWRVAALGLCDVQPGCCHDGCAGCCQSGALVASVRMNGADAGMLFG